MCKPVLLLLGFFLSLFAGAQQHKVTFVLRKLPAHHRSSEPIYLVGSFNRWNPKDARYKLTTVDNKPGITIELPKGMLEYKFTKGSWDESESSADGMPTANRQVEINGDTLIEGEIAAWSDHFPKKPRNSTAGKNVHIVDTAFFIPELNRYRRVWIYLPPTYTGSKKRYPVLYMQDGQNVFDEKTSFSGEWGVDETLDSLGEQHGEMIVVAVDNGGEKRMQEYAPYDMERYGKGEGERYATFLAKTLQPYINKHYRTLKRPKYNFVAGSSMGGLISYYTALRFPDHFGGAGVFSPAFWVNPPIKKLDGTLAKKLKSAFFFFAGAKESKEMVPDMLQVAQEVKKVSKSVVETVVDEHGTHSEATWRAIFPRFHQWMMEQVKERKG
jgi:predicted alpha/beta superfamily hydrolase